MASVLLGCCGDVGRELRVLTCVHVCCAYDRVQTDGTTPLIIASANGHVEVVRALVDRSAAVNQADVCLRALWSMLRLLVFWSVVRTLPVLVHGGASSQRVLCQMLDWYIQVVRRQGWDSCVSGVLPVDLGHVLPLCVARVLLCACVCCVVVVAVGLRAEQWCHPTDCRQLGWPCGGREGTG